MPAPGAGPSRRSHTKSRKGCKTCKKRHIRCDETFPQCRNCTKHQVRCDYLDESSQPTQAQSGNVPLPALPWTPEIEAAIDHWQQIGEASLGSYSINLTASGHNYSRSDLHLMYFMLVGGQSAESGQYTVWHSTNRHIFAHARYRPFLTHAALALHALALAWEHDSPDIKSLAYHHGAIALQGLQEAIADYSEEHGDAILLASMLLSWQANDWRSWVSLTSGIRTLVTNMMPLKSQSSIPHILDDLCLSIHESFPANLQDSPLTATGVNEYRNTLQQMYSALETLQPYIAGRREAVWIDQIKDYVDRLMSAQPPSNPDEQFNYLYVFRKYLFWVPRMALKTQNKDMMTLVVLSYLYSTSLQLEQLFPDVAPAFCTNLAAPPLEEIMQTFDSLQQGDTSAHAQQVATMAFLLDHPRSVLGSHQARIQTLLGLPQVQHPTAGYDAVNTDFQYTMEAFAMAGHRSPAFGPSPMHHRVSSDVSSASGSPFLEVPNAYVENIRSAQYPTPSMTLPSMPRSPEESDQEHFMSVAEGGYDTSGGSRHGSRSLPSSGKGKLRRP